jgi:hypothetical protein
VVFWPESNILWYPREIHFISGWTLNHMQMCHSCHPRVQTGYIANTPALEPCYNKYKPQSLNTLTRTPTPSRMAAANPAEIAANMTLDEFKKATYEQQQDHMLATLAALLQHRELYPEDRKTHVETVLRKFSSGMQQKYRLTQGIRAPPRSRSGYHHRVPRRSQ